MMIASLNEKGYNAFAVSVPSAEEIVSILGLAAPVFITLMSKVYILQLFEDDALCNCFFYVELTTQYSIFRWRSTHCLYISPHLWAQLLWLLTR